MWPVVWKLWFDVFEIMFTVKEQHAAAENKNNMISTFASMAEWTKTPLHTKEAQTLYVINSYLEWRKNRMFL